MRFSRLFRICCRGSVELTNAVDPCVPVGRDGSSPRQPDALLTCYLRDVTTQLFTGNRDGW